MQYYNFRRTAFRSPQDRFQGIERVVRAYGNKDVARPYAHVRLRQIGSLGEIELVQFQVYLLAALALHPLFRNLESGERDVKPH